MTNWESENHSDFLEIELYGSKCEMPAKRKCPGGPYTTSGGKGKN